MEMPITPSSLMLPWICIPSESAGALRQQSVEFASHSIKKPHWMGAPSPFTNVPATFGTPIKISTSLTPEPMVTNVFDRIIPLLLRHGGSNSKKYMPSASDIVNVPVPSRLVGPLAVGPLAQFAS